MKCLSNILMQFLCLLRKEVYVFDLSSKQYWCICEVANNCSCFSFHTINQKSIVIGSKYGSIHTVDLGELTKIRYIQMHQN